MNIFDIISEGRDAPLYHGTSLFSAMNALKENQIKGVTSQDSSKLYPAQKSSYTPIFGVSLSRSIMTAYEFGPVIFQLDQRKLVHNYKLVPIDFWTSAHNHGPSERAKNSRQYEYEEFCIGAITPLSRYLVAINLTSRASAIKNFGEEQLEILLNHRLLKIDGKFIHRD